MPKVHVQARVDAELVRWFEQNFTAATKQSFVEGCFRYLKLAVESGRLPTPESYLAVSAVEAYTKTNEVT